MIITITNQKGGSGKTTTAALIALSQAAAGKLIQIDFNKSESESMITILRIILCKGRA
jgi:cellulose biosynthesis protein BcsQ